MGSHALWLELLLPLCEWLWLSRDGLAMAVAKGGGWSKLWLTCKFL